MKARKDRNSVISCTVGHPACATRRYGNLPTALASTQRRVITAVVATIFALPGLAGSAATALLAGSAAGAIAMSSAWAEVLVTTRTLRATTTIGSGDVALINSHAAPGSATSPEQAIGMEARVTLYSGRPIPLASLAPPAMVERNQPVQLVFTEGGLNIRAEGRALGRAGEGELVRVMNLASRSTVSGRVTGPGTVEVTP